VLTRNFAPGAASYGRYANSAFTRTGTINVYSEYLEVEGLPKGQEPPAIFYKICAEKNATKCSLSASEAQGAGMSEVGRIIDATTRVGSFTHDPSACPFGGDFCTYLITFVSRDSAYNSIAMRVSAEFDDPGDVVLTKEYVNYVQYGEFLPYEINPESNADLQPSISKLSIRLMSIQGDADLFLSFSTPNPDLDNYDYCSRQKTWIDEITLVEHND
jgi:hypothetical protein